MDRPLPDGEFTCHRSVIGVFLLAEEGTDIDYILTHDADHPLTIATAPKTESSMKIAPLLTSLLILLAINVTYATSAEDEYKKLKGKWIGTESGSSDTDAVDGEFDGKEFHMSNKKTGEWYKGKFELNENETPKQIVGTITDCSVKEAVGSEFNGIYQLSDDSLTMAARAPGQPGFPKDFKDKEARVFSFTRTKPTKKSKPLMLTPQQVR